MEIIKIGGVEFYEKEIADIYQSEKYVVTYSNIYQIFYSVNAGYYGIKIISKPTKGGVGFAKRGRFNVMDAESINRMLGEKVLIEKTG